MLEENDKTKISVDFYVCSILTKIENKVCQGSQYLQSDISFEICTISKVQIGGVKSKIPFHTDVDKIQ